MQKRIILMSGIPGSGKGTLVSSLIQKHLGSEAKTYSPVLRSSYWFPQPHATILSADHYFVEQDRSCSFVFRPENIGLAHGECLRNYIELIQEEYEPLIIVDNTNTTNEELAPYIAIAQAYQHPVEVITLMCSSSEQAEKVGSRNMHGVPVAACLAMHQNLLRRQPPFHWSPDFGVTFTQENVIL